MHISRVIQALRGDGLIVRKRNTLTVLDWDGLCKAGEFDPTYLHIEKDKLG